MPLISICIPAYKNKNFLERLLKSISIQTFRDFEVIVSDNIPTNELEGVCYKYGQLFSLKYYKNAKPPGTPANWNLPFPKQRVTG